VITTLTNIIVADVNSHQNTYTAATGWVVSAQFHAGVPSHPYTVFLQSPATVHGWDSAHRHRISATELTPPLDGLSHNDPMPTTPPLIAVW
jgi:hypothetical protein